MTSSFVRLDAVFLIDSTAAFLVDSTAALRVGSFDPRAGELWVGERGGPNRWARRRFAFSFGAMSDPIRDRSGTVSVIFVAERVIPRVLKTRVKATKRHAREIMDV